MRGVGYAYAEGGDEIKFFLPNATETIAREVAEALRRTVETLKFEGAAAGSLVTATLGIAYVGHGEDAAPLAARANVAKNRAKVDGKNRTLMWSEDFD